MSESEPISFDIWAAWIKQGLHAGDKASLEKFTMVEVQAILAELNELDLSKNGNGHRAVSEIDFRSEMSIVVYDPLAIRKFPEVDVAPDSETRVMAFNNEKVIFNELKRLACIFTDKLSELLTTFNNPKVQTNDSNYNNDTLNIFPDLISKFKTNEKQDSIDALEQMIALISAEMDKIENLENLHTTFVDIDHWLDELLDLARYQVIDRHKNNSHLVGSLAESINNSPELYNQLRIFLDSLILWRNLFMYLKRVRLDNAQLTMLKVD